MSQSQLTNVASATTFVMRSKSVSASKLSLLSTSYSWKKPLMNLIRFERSAKQDFNTSE